MPPAGGSIFDAPRRSRWPLVVAAVAGLTGLLGWLAAYAF